MLALLGEEHTGCLHWLRPSDWRCCQNIPSGVELVGHLIDCWAWGSSSPYPQLCQPQETVSYSQMYWGRGNPSIYIPASMCLYDRAARGERDHPLVTGTGKQFFPTTPLHRGIDARIPHLPAWPWLHPCPCVCVPAQQSSKGSSPLCPHCSLCNAGT